MTQTPGTLRPDEHHPAADSAMAWLQEYLGRDPQRAFVLVESFASNAIEGNRLAEICGETLRRILDREPVSDRYLLGLVWTIREMDGMATHDDPYEVNTDDALFMLPEEALKKLRAKLDDEGVVDWETLRQDLAVMLAPQQQLREGMGDAWRYYLPLADKIIKLVRERIE